MDCLLYTSDAADDLTRVDIGGCRFFQAEDGIRDAQESRGLGDVYKRQGYRKLYVTSLGAGAINGLGTYHKSDGTNYRLIAHDTKLYTQDNNLQPAEIKSGLTSGKANFFTLADISYMLNGSDYVSYDGTTCADVIWNITNHICLLY